ncbi:hypothetical protein [Roseovarius sp. MMSF_3281]|uniref:hypothetical protein n=1 Tax=Roseovarius sp. MMSF_3281 TaxID=3046694 RepID=UPI00273DAE45|nr:hypothetical protein [Roseovarius sp. MMSF_3281]
MKIRFSPIRSDEQLWLSKSGDAVTVNDLTLDFTSLPDDSLLPRDSIDCPWIAGDVSRIDGVVHLALFLPHGANAPTDRRFPPEVSVSEDGPIALPIAEEEVNE